ncbi:hypothetical protein ACRAWF_06550 [Streptomyces sp. L7]
MIGASNFSGWHLMKALGGLPVSAAYFPRYVANQTYYSLIGRDYEWELMPLGLDQGARRGRLVARSAGAASPARSAAAGRSPEASRLPHTCRFRRRRCPTSTALPRDRRDRPGRRRRSGKSDPADRPQLAAAPPDRRDACSSARATTPQLLLKIWRGLAGR